VGRNTERDYNDNKLGEMRVHLAREKTNAWLKIT